MHLSVYHFVPDKTDSVVTRWIVMTDIHGSLGVYPFDLGDLLTFHLVP